MADDPPRPPWPSRLTPISSREVITQGAREIAVDDFIDSHLREAEPPTHRRLDPGVAPGAPAPPPGWAPAGPPRPGNTAKPYQPSVKTIPMQAVAPAQRPAPPPAPPPPTDDDGGGRTMMLTPEQAEAAARALAAATAAAAPQQPAAHAPPKAGLSGTIMMEAIGPAPPMPPPVPPPAAPPPVQMPSYIAPAVPQGPAPEPPLAQPLAQPGYEPFPEPTYVPPKKGGAGILIGVGIAFAVVAGLAVAYWQGLFHLPIGGSPSSKSSAASRSEPTSAPAPATASAAATPGSSSPAQPSASAGGAPPVAAPPSGDEKPLLSFEAALTVTSSIDAEVVVQGLSIGRTNRRLVTRCGPKNVRLRVEGKGWVSPGQPVQITCMQSTSVTIEPSS